MPYDNSLTGALFKNEEKRPDKKDPDYRGQCEMHGEAYWIDAWLNTAKQGKYAGKTFMSLKFKPKDDKSARKAIEAMPASKPKAPEFNDDIPF